MKPVIITIMALIGIPFISIPAYCQGCSDAGFCTLGSLKHNADSAARKHKITILSAIGVGDEGVVVVTPALQYDLHVTAQWVVQGKVTANYASGNLGTATGAGDVFLTAVHSSILHTRWKKSWLIGGKFPLHPGNLTHMGRPLPMQYQSSLGTIDFIAGITISDKRWQFSAAWQQPLSGINRNNFLPVYWDTPEASAYPSTNDFNRRGDVLARGSRTFFPGKKVTINAGLLAIYHLAEDTYIDASIRNTPIPLEGSHGLTLNITTAVLFTLNDNVKIGLTAGAPVVVRDVRPDGLTRSFVLAPEIQWILK
jgi:hypothetical protein